VFLFADLTQTVEAAAVVAALAAVAAAG